MLTCEVCDRDVPVLDLATFLRDGATCPTCYATFIVLCIPRQFPVLERGSAAVLITNSPGADVVFNGVVAGGDVVVEGRRLR